MSYATSVQSNRNLWIDYRNYKNPEAFQSSKAFPPISNYFCGNNAARYLHKSSSEESCRETEPGWEKTLNQVVAGKYPEDCYNMIKPIPVLTKQTFVPNCDILAGNGYNVSFIVPPKKDKGVAYSGVGISMVITWEGTRVSKIVWTLDRDETTTLMCSGSTLYFYDKYSEHPEYIKPPFVEQSYDVSDDKRGITISDSWHGYTTLVDGSTEFTELVIPKEDFPKTWEMEFEPIYGDNNDEYPCLIVDHMYRTYVRDCDVFLNLDYSPLKIKETL